MHDGGAFSESLFLLMLFSFHEQSRSKYSLVSVNTPVVGPRGQRCHVLQQDRGLDATCRT